MKRATISEAPAILNLNDKAMWVLGHNAVVDGVLEPLRFAVRTSWLTGVPDFREKYDPALFKALGIDHFQDLYPAGVDLPVEPQGEKR